MPSKYSLKCFLTFFFMPAVIRSETLEKNYIAFLKARIGTHSVEVIRSEKSPIVLVIDATEPMDVIQSSDKHSKVA